MTDWSSYTGEFSVQGTDFASKPKPPWPPSREHSWSRICDYQHCQVCKKPVKDEPHGGFCGELACKVCDAFMMGHKKPPRIGKPSATPTPHYSRHYTSIITDDLEESSKPITRELYQKWLDHNKSKKEVNMCEDETQAFEHQTLYEVITTYGEDRENVVVERTEVVAENEQRARMQAKDAINSSWDMDYVEQSVNVICSVRVKRKPREILKG